MMLRKQFIIIGSIVVLIQLLVPAWMIYQKELVIQKGTTYLFSVAPVDPHDPFSGKYIYLNFQNTSFISDRHIDVEYGESIYAVLEKDDQEKAVIKMLKTYPPNDQEEYIKVSVSYSDSNRIQIEYPFNVFYMEEFKASKAEDIYRKNITQEENAFAVVKVYDGQYTITDVIINGKSIVELSR
jgi:uncharacterized membrane-anchored protein